MALVRAAVSVAILAVEAGVASAASQPASRLVDRTVLCKTYGAGYPDPLRILRVAAAPRLGTTSEPYVQALNGPDGTPQSVVAQIAMGANRPDQVIVSRVACGQTSLRIPLSAKGLRNGATEFGGRFRCPVPAVILIRIRAVFRNPVTFSPAVDARYLSIATGRIGDGSLAVTTKSKVPIFFATVDRKSGKASIFVAKPRCQLQK